MERTRTALRINAAVTAAAGVLCAAAAGPVADLLDVATTPVRVVGVGFVAFAAVVAWAAGVAPDGFRPAVLAIGVADAAYVVASVVLVAAGAFAAAGAVAVLAVAAVVGAFATLELRAAADLAPRRRGAI